MDWIELVFKHVVVKIFLAFTALCAIMFLMVILLFKFQQPQSAEPATSVVAPVVGSKCAGASNRVRHADLVQEIIAIHYAHNFCCVYRDGQVEEQIEKAIYIANKTYGMDCTLKDYQN